MVKVSKQTGGAGKEMVRQLSRRMPRGWTTAIDQGAAQELQSTIDSSLPRRIITGASLGTAAGHAAQEAARAIRSGATHGAADLGGGGRRKRKSRKSRTRRKSRTKRKSKRSTSRKKRKYRSRRTTRRK